MYKKITAAIAATVMITALIASLGAVAGDATLEEPSHPAKVRGGTRQLISIEVTNPSDTDNVDNVKIWVSDSPGLLENWVAGANDKENLEIGADNLENAVPSIKQAGENLKLAADNKKSAGSDFVTAGENLRATGANDWEAAALSGGGVTDAGDNAFLLVRSAGSDLKKVGDAMDNEIENLDYIASYLSSANTSLTRAAADGSSPKENIENFSADAADNVADAASYLSDAATDLKGGKINAAASDLDTAEDNLYSAGIDLEGLDADVGASLKVAGSDLSAAAAKLQDAYNFLDNAGYALGVAENYMRSAGGYIDNIGVLESAGDNIEVAADNLENAETALRTNDNILMAGENLANASDRLSDAASVLGAALGGDELSDAATDLSEAADNLKDSGQVNLKVAGQELVNAGNNVTAAATKMANTAGDIAPATWEVGDSDTDWIRFDSIAENYLGPSGSQTFTFLADVADIGNIEKDYTLEIQYTKTGATYSFDSDNLTLTVDSKLPTLQINVTQENVGETNLINEGTATLTVTASEELDNLGPIHIENNDNLLPPITRSDLSTTDNIVFTHEFTAGAWDENSPIDVTVDSATDLVANENTSGMDNTFTVDTKPPILRDSGIPGLVSGMEQKARADGTTFDNVDNEADHAFSGGVVDNYQGENIQGYNNVTVSIEVDGTTYDPIYKMPDNENLFYVSGGVTLSEEVNSIVKVTATDRTGNSTSENVENIFIDTKKPSVSSWSIAGSDWTENEQVISSDKPTIDLTIADTGLGVANVDENLDIGLDNDENYLNDFSYGSLENANAYEWDAEAGEAFYENTIENAGDGLVDGIHYVGVFMSDNIAHAGDENVIKYRSFRIDTTAPTKPTLDETVGGSSTDPGLITREDTVSIRGTVDKESWEEYADLGVKVYVGSSVQNTVDVGSDGTWSADVSLSSGTNRIRASLVDAVGNESSAKSLYGYVYSDTQAPTVELTGPGSGITTDNKVITVSGSVSDDLSSAPELELYVNNERKYPGANGEFSVNVPLAKGSNTITVVAKDEAGNLSASKTVTVTRSVPAAANWAMYATIGAIIAIILAAIAIIRRGS